MIQSKSPFCAILKNIPPVLTFTTAHIREMRGTRTCCSSACSLSYAQGNRHLPHTITAMGIWASPSRLTYAAENSRKHHQTLDIHAVGGANFSQINGCNPSRCTTPAGAGRVAGSAWEPKGHSMCTVDLWKAQGFDGTLQW